MRSQVEQLYLDFKYKDVPLEEQEYFIGAHNGHAVDSILNPITNKTLLYGPMDCGKTHLAHLFKKKFQAIELTANNIKTNPFIDGDVFLLDNLPWPHMDTELLHFFNFTANKIVLFVSRLPVKLWNIELYDLYTRLTTVNTICIEDIDYQTAKQMLEKFLKQFSLHIQSREIDFIIQNCKHSISQIKSIASAIDHFSIKENKKISHQALKDILQKLANAN